MAQDGVESAEDRLEGGKMPFGFFLAAGNTTDE